MAQYRPQPPPSDLAAAYAQAQEELAAQQESGSSDSLRLIPMFGEPEVVKPVQSPVYTARTLPESSMT